MFLHSLEVIRGIIFVHFPNELLAYGRIDGGRIFGEDMTAVGMHRGIIIPWGDWDDICAYMAEVEKKGLAATLPNSNILMSITELTLPLCRYIGHDAFSGCMYLREIHCPEVVQISSCAFQGCLALQVIDLPKVIAVDGHAFEYCALEEVSLPACRELGEYALGTCNLLKRVDLPVCTKVGKWAVTNRQLIKDLKLKVLKNRLIPKKTK